MPKALVILLALVASGCAMLQHPASVVDRVSASVIRVTSHDAWGEGTCSGFVIAPQRVMTAAHCIADKMLADGKDAVVVKVDKHYDLALLRVDKLLKPSITLRDRPVERFEGLIAIGYGYGWTRLSVLEVQAFLINNAVEEDGAVGIIVQGSYIGGMSGGPVVDKSGLVVGIVQRSSTTIGYGVGTLFMHAFLLGTDTNVSGRNSEQTNRSLSNVVPIPFHPYGRHHHVD